MKFLCVLIWIYLLTVSCGGKTEASSKDECQDGWMLIHRSCILFVRTFATWDDAKVDCENKGGHLAIISDKQEEDGFREVMGNQIKSSRNHTYWWIGLRRVTNYTTGDDGYYWTDNEKYNQKVPQWAPGEPSSGKSSSSGNGIEDCVQLNYQTWLADERCNAKKPYICEELRLTPPPNITNTITTVNPVTTTKSTTTEDSTKSPPTTTNKGFKTSSTPASSTPVLVKPSTSATEVIEHSTGSPNSGKPNTGRPGNAGNSSGKNNSDSTDKPKPTGSQTPSNKSKPTSGSEDKPGKPTGPPTTTDKGTVTITTTKAPRDAFKGCFAVNYESTCPPVEAVGIFWNRTEPGMKASVQCEEGKATWFCAKNPTCWRGEPDVKKCTSKAIQDLTSQAEEIKSHPEDSDKVIAFTEDLAEAVTDTGKQMSQQDIFQTTKLIEVASKTKPKNASSAKDVIKNVVKVGSGLVSNDKKTTWSGMKAENKRAIASSLLNSVESVSVQMLKSFDKPGIEKIDDENMAVELQVIDVNKLGNDIDADVTYRSKKNSFSIPPENLINFSTDGLARLVFISYSNMAGLLVPENLDHGNMETRVISKVLSASIGVNTSSHVTLPKPITYTFATEYRGDASQWKKLCSFWNFSLGYTGAWSQVGCSLHRYNESHTTCQCNHLTNFAILMDVHSTKMSSLHTTALSYITYVGIIISIICLFLSFVTFTCLSLNCMFSPRRESLARGYEYTGGDSAGSHGSAALQKRSVQGERNSIHKNLVVCLFVAEVLFLAGVKRTDEKLACSIIAGCLHYFFLSSFVWMFIEGIHILFMLVQVFDAAKSRLRYYYVIGYGAPLVVVGVSALIYHEGYGTEQYCWLTNNRLFIWSFAGPVAFILMVNLMILIYAMSAVCKHSEYVFSKEKSATGNLQGWIQGALALEVLLGLTWVFGYFYISEDAIPMAYLFTIFNSFQGLFIFVFHCILNKKVRKEYERFIDYKRPMSSGTHSKSTNGSAGNATTSYAMTQSRKQSGFTELNNPTRNGFSSA